ncbi:Na(+)/H(+) exchange regulatory cofactor NHE-RF2 [Bombina bombina]|uniref:Na(+)/H(+) exchange regulatory cofactor NHE-RF2 n=1 Tax=Bombina bombina TaxID=8345 RepID=UPI00235A5D85|nr:Na(+)/H(+) exchange regulatory cofactor NHE-RF2 [Bombina bombina]
MAQEKLRPRLCHIQKGEQGYGFHLHGEKGKTGQYIRKVEPGSPAEAAGLRAGDRVLEVNGENVEKETHHQVVQRIKAMENETRLLVVDRETDEYLRLKDSSSPAETQSNSSAPPTPSVGNNNGEIWKSKEETSVDNHKEQIQNNHSTENGKQDINGQVTQRCPRLCHLKKGSNGYGFNLHSEKSRPGQFIRSVDPGSPAAKAGLKPQDRLVEVNGQNVDSMKHSEVVTNIKSRENETTLLVVDPETDDYYKKLGVTPTEAHAKGAIPQPLTNGTAQTQLNGGSSTSSSHSDLQNPDKDIQGNDLNTKDPFEESGLRLSPTAAEAKEKARAKRSNKRAPQMDWSKKHEIFSNF